jgi:NAD(P)H-hydrate epimerase
MGAPLLNREQCREIDRRAIEELGIPGLVLMENAGRGCVDVFERVGIDGPIAILCGKGNNAGDGFVIARHLQVRDYACCVFLTCPPDELRGDAATNYVILSRLDVPIASSLAELDSIRPDWIVDAMLGTGAVGEPRPPFDAAIDWMNSQTSKKLAIDVPSGLDCDTGQPAAHAVRADHTCAFAAMKTGFTQPSARPFTGEVHVCDIGLPPRFLADVGLL